MASHEDMGHHVKIYRNVFLALMALTIATVAVSYLHLAVALAIIVAMAIAAVKGSLVAAYFMHLKDERPAIYWLLMLTAVFWVTLMSMPVLSYLDAIHLR